jgi:hypothetical protein
MQEEDMATDITLQQSARAPQARVSLFLASLVLVVLNSVLAQAQTATWNGGGGNWAPCPPQGTALWDTCNQQPPVYPSGNYNAIVNGGPVTLGSGNGISIVNLTVGTGQSVIVTPGYLFITGSSVQNNGTISVGAGNGFDLMGSQTTTLSGTGTVTLTDPTARFWGGNGTPTLINQQTVQGAGNFAFDLNLTNQGTINASSGTLSIQPTSTINTGTMEASSGGILTFANGVPAPYNNAGGTIKALSGGTVNLQNGVYTGGTLTTVGTGVITASGAAVLNGLTNSGTLQILNANTGTLENTINNRGVIQIPSSTLYISGGVTVSGAGNVLMSGNGQVQQLNGPGDSLINQQLIHGAGNIFELPLTNQATIAADSSGNTLSLAGGTTTNTSVLQASGGGILQLTNSNTVNNVGGTIEALDGSTVNLGATVKGGTLSTTGSGTIQSQNATLDGTVNVVTNTGTLDVANGYDLFLQGTVDNTGTIAATGNSFVVLNQPSTLSGSGTLTMGPNTALFGSGNAFTNQSTIEGAGTIGDSNPMPITNTGTIIANQTSPLSITPDATGFKNTGTLSVNTGSTLNVTGLFTNLKKGALTGGTYTVSGLLNLQNSIVTNNANITLTGSAAEIFDNFHSVNALSALTSNSAKGILSLQSGQGLTTSANLANKGKLTIGTSSSLNAGGSFTQSGGTTTVDGTLGATAGITLSKGTLQGQGILVATVNSSAILNVGDSTSTAGLLTISGSYAENATGTLNVAVNGTQVGTQYSQLAVANSASLNGTLIIKLKKGFVPVVGTNFDILTASSVSGKFLTVKGTSINSGEHFDVVYKSGSVTLNVASGP